MYVQVRDVQSLQSAKIINLFKLDIKTCKKESFTFFSTSTNTV